MDNQKIARELLIIAKSLTSTESITAATTNGIKGVLSFTRLLGLNFNGGSKGDFSVNINKKEFDKLASGEYLKVTASITLR